MRLAKFTLVRIIWRHRRITCGYLHYPRRGCGSYGHIRIIGNLAVYFEDAFQQPLCSRGNLSASGDGIGVPGGGPMLLGTGPVLLRTALVLLETACVPRDGSGAPGDGSLLLETAWCSWRRANRSPGTSSLHAPVRLRPFFQWLSELIRPESGPISNQVARGGERSYELTRVVVRQFAGPSDG